MFQIGGGANLDSFSEVININYQKFFGYFFTFQVLLTKCVLNLAIPNFFFFKCLVQSTMISAAEILCSTFSSAPVE